ncbi:hypothetical protein SS50377_22119 [Spironucleus salmonicida]|uniref:Uncharacterized protein n=1 Tax=Spironucleus salmonicida TaxID=348837 RepID=V6LPT6_9EUKA|nr:hypothetical protein SS50377_22119 [Spironucleus salmonicida]|eukprot:EST45721.1 Hypothetical protein SS50377_14292 [Spironucleus salmonicida]
MSYLDLLNFSNTFPGSHLVYKSPITDEVFDDLQIYHEYLFSLKFKYYDSFFSSKQLSFIQILDMDINTARLLLESPRSYVLQALVHHKLELSQPKRGELIFPGDIIEFSEQTYLIVGVQSEQVIAKRCVTSLPISFIAKQGILAGKLALFNELTPVFTQRKKFNEIKDMIDFKEIFQLNELEQFIQCNFENYDQVFDCLYSMFLLMNDIVQKFFDNIRQFDLFSSQQKNLMLQLNADNAKYVLVMTPQYEQKLLQLQSYQLFIQQNGNIFNEKLLKHTDVNENDLEEDQQIFIQFLLNANQQELLFDLKSTLVVQNIEIEQPGLEDLINLIFNQANTIIDPQLFQLYQFFYHYSSLLKMPLITIDEFVECFLFDGSQQYFNAFSPLYNNKVQPFIYQFICQLIQLLFQQEPVNIGFLQASKNQDEDDIQQSKWTLSSIKSTVNINSTFKIEDQLQTHKEYKQVVDSSLTESNEPGDYSYDSSSLNEFIENSLTGSQSSNDEYTNDSISNESDYNIVEQKQTRVSKKSIQKEKQNKLKTKIQKIQGDVPQLSIKKSLKYQQDQELDEEDEDNQISSIKQIQKDVISIVPLQNKEKLGSCDEVWIEQLLYYIVQVSLRDKDIIAIQFICVLLNHLTNQFDDIFHKIYSKSENYSMYKLSSQVVNVMMKRYSLLYQFENSLTKKFWAPSFDYPLNSFITYQEFYKTNYDSEFTVLQITQDEAELFSQKISKKIDRSARQDQIFEKIKNHPILTFSYLPVHIKVKFFTWLITQVLQSDKLIQIQHDAEIQYLSLLQEVKQLRNQVTYFNKKELIQKRQEDYDTLISNQKNQLKKLNICPRNQQKIAQLNLEIQLTLNEYEMQVKAAEELRLRKLESTLFQLFLITFSGNILTDSNTGSQIIFAGDYFLYKNQKLIKLTQLNVQQLQLLVDKQNKFLFNYPNSEYYNYQFMASNIPNKKIKIINALDINIFAQPLNIPNIQKYHLDNAYQFGQMRLGEDQFLKFLDQNL